MVFSNSVCGAPRIGFAGRLAVNAARLHVRYRVLVGSGATPPDQPPQFFGTPFAVDVAVPGVDAKTTMVSVAPDGFKKLAAPILGMTWATDWTTLDADAPAAGPELGFTVRAGSSPNGPTCGGGPIPPPVDTIVLIDSVTAP